MKKKTKRIFIIIGIFFLIGLGVAIDEGVRYFFATPITPSEPDKPSQQIVIKGEPGTISIENEKFYNDMFRCIITSTGYGKIEYTLPRPTRWYPEEPKKHFLGFGLATSIADGEWLYGGFIQYRYRVIKDISIMMQYYAVANKTDHYDTGIKFGVEFGLK